MSRRSNSTDWDEESPLDRLARSRLSVLSVSSANETILDALPLPKIHNGRKPLDINSSTIYEESGASPISSAASQGSGFSYVTANTSASDLDGQNSMFSKVSGGAWPVGSPPKARDVHSDTNQGREREEFTTPGSPRLRLELNSSKDKNVLDFDFTPSTPRSISRPQSQAQSPVAGQQALSAKYGSPMPYLNFSQTVSDKTLLPPRPQIKRHQSSVSWDPSNYCQTHNFPSSPYKNNAYCATTSQESLVYGLPAPPPSRKTAQTNAMYRRSLREFDIPIGIHRPNTPNSEKAQLNLAPGKSH